MHHQSSHCVNKPLFILVSFQATKSLEWTAHWFTWDMCRKNSTAHRPFIKGMMEIFFVVFFFLPFFSLVLSLSFSLHLSAIPLGLIVIPGDSDLETCRVQIEKLQEVKRQSWGGVLGRREDEQKRRSSRESCEWGKEGQKRSAN